MRADDGGLNVERGDQSPIIRHAPPIRQVPAHTDRFDDQNRLELLQPEARIGAYEFAFYNSGLC